MAAILSTEVPQEIIDKIPNVIVKEILLLSIQMRNIDRIKKDVWSPNWLDKEYIRNTIFYILDDYYSSTIQMWKIQKNPFLYEEIFKRFSQCQCCKRHQHFRPSLRCRYVSYHPRYYAQIPENRQINLFHEPNYNSKRENEVKFRKEFGFGFVRSWFDEPSCRCICRTFCRRYINLTNYFKGKIITNEEYQSSIDEMNEFMDELED